MARQSAHYQPTLENLETRLAPAISVTVLPNDVLVIHGSEDAEHVAITEDGYGHVTVQAGDFIGDYSGIRKIRVRLRGGDDTLTYTRPEVFFPLVYPGPVAMPLNLKVNMGQGDDQASFSFLEGMGNSKAKVLIHGADGDDQVTLNVGEMHRGRLRFVATLGLGDDTFQGSLNGALTGRSRVAVAVVGIEGNNQMSMECQADLGKRAKLGVFLVGGSGTDEIFARYAGRNEGIVGVWTSGEDGDDSASAEIAFDSGSTGAAALGGVGGTGDDTLTLLVNGDGDLRFKIFTLDGGDGNDTSIATPNVDLFNIENQLPPP